MENTNMSNKHKFADSKSIATCDYDDDKGELIIHFTSGATYHYPDCPKDHYHNLKKADSPGKFFHRKIRAFKATKK